MSEDTDQAEAETQGAPELDLPTHSVHWGATQRRTAADLTDEERAYHRKIYGVTHRERYGKPDGVCVTYCLTPGQRRRGIRCPCCFQNVEIRPFDGAEIEPGITHAERFSAWVGGWFGSFFEALMYPFRVGRAHTEAMIKDILQEAMAAGLSAEVDGLTDILTVLEGIEGELRAIRNAAELAGESSGLPDHVPARNGRYGHLGTPERLTHERDTPRLPNNGPGQTRARDRVPVHRGRVHPGLVGRGGVLVSALEDRQRWLDHLAECVGCPAIRCHAGDELAAAVQEDLDPGTSWAGVYRPRESEHGPARAARERNNGAISDADRLRIAQDKAAEGPEIV